MLNLVVLIGRLTHDVEMRYTQSGKEVANFSLAVNRKFNREETDFINCVVWGKQAENCANYIGKGSLVAVQGRIQVRSYEDKDGNKRKAFEVVADDVRFLDKKGDSKPKDDWSDLGREVSLNDISLQDDDDTIPF